MRNVQSPKLVQRHQPWLRVIIFLYLNDEATLRKEGAKSDPYRVFRRMVDRGEIGDDFEANLTLWERTYKPV